MVAQIFTSISRLRFASATLAYVLEIFWAKVSSVIERNLANYKIKVKHGKMVVTHTVVKCECGSVSC